MDNYIISCNPERFDIIQYWTHSNEVYWKQTKKFCIGDQVYVYVGKPYSRLMFQCEVTDINIPSITDENGYYSTYDSGRNKDKPFMKIILKEELPDKGLTLNDLFKHGLKTVQCTTKADEELIKYILSIKRNYKKSI